MYPIQSFTHGEGHYTNWLIIIELLNYSHKNASLSGGHLVLGSWKGCPNFKI